GATRVPAVRCSVSGPTPTGEPSAAKMVSAPAEAWACEPIAAASASASACAAVSPVIVRLVAPGVPPFSRNVQPFAGEVTVAVTCTVYCVPSTVIFQRSPSPFAGVPAGSRLALVEYLVRTVPETVAGVRSAPGTILKFDGVNEPALVTYTVVSLLVSTKPA